MARRLAWAGILRQLRERNNGLQSIRQRSLLCIHPYRRVEQTLVWLSLVANGDFENQVLALSGINASRTFDTSDGTIRGDAQVWPIWSRNPRTRHAGVAGSEPRRHSHRHPLLCAASSATRIISSNVVCLSSDDRCSPVLMSSLTVQIANASAPFSAAIGYIPAASISTPSMSY